MIYQISLVYLNHYYFVIFQAGFGRHYLKLDALRSVKEQRFKCENICPKMLKIYKTWSTTNLILTHNEAFHGGHSQKVNKYSYFSSLIENDYKRASSALE